MSWDYAFNVALGYLLGSVPAGLVVGYLWLRRDIRELGSGVTGTTNVMRNAGHAAGIVVMVLDISKGLIPAVVGRFVFDSNGVAAAGAGAAVIGHVWPVLAGFRGGRGVATAFGGILGLTPMVALVFPVLGAAILVLTRIVSVMSVVGTALAALALVILAAGGWEPWEFAAYAVLAVAIVEVRHIPNMRRLIAGTEPRIGRGRKRAAAN